MIKIRLARMGVKNKPVYRIVAIDSKKKVGGKPLAILGFWNPKEKTFKIDEQKLKLWKQRGAKLSSKLVSLVK